MSSTALPLSAQVVRVENGGFRAVNPTLGNNSIIYTDPFAPPVNNSIIYTDPFAPPVNGSIIYGSPIPSPSITYPSNFYSYPNYYYPGSVNRTTLTNPVLVNPTIRDSTLINPTIIKIQNPRRSRVTERNTTILRPINY